MTYMTGSYCTYQGPRVSNGKEWLYFHKATHFPNLNPPYTRFDYMRKADIEDLRRQEIEKDPLKDEL